MRVLAIMFLLICLGGAPGHGATFNVPSEYPTIQAAVDAAAYSGDRILVDDGEYLEVVLVLMKYVDIVSQHGAAETTVSSISFTSQPMPYCGGSVVGFRITGNLSAGEVGSFLLRRCEILGSVAIWSTVAGPTRVEIDSCFVRSGLGVGNRGQTEVSDCEVSGGGIGIGLSYNAVVTRCSVTGGSVSLSCAFCSISSCVLEGGSVRIDARDVGFADNNVVTSGNVEVDVADYTGYGGAAVGGNTILNGGIVVLSDARHEVRMSANTVYGCAGDGIRIEGQPGGSSYLSRNIVAVCDRGIVWATPPQSADFLCNVSPR
jgi:hypothetical protein